MTVTARQGKGQAKIAAAALARYNRLKQLSAEGVAFKDACAAVGMSDDGVRHALYKRTGSTKWPIAQ